MELTPDDVRDVLRVLDSSGLDELHLELADLTLTVRREGATGWTAEQQVSRAPQPGAPPFVDVGDSVDEETVVGIVETMKMMTPVHAGVRGTVVEFRVGNGEFADADAVLLVVEPVPGGGAGG